MLMEVDPELDDTLMDAESVETLILSDATPEEFGLGFDGLLGDEGEELGLDPLEDGLSSRAAPLRKDSMMLDAALSDPLPELEEESDPGAES